MVEIVSKAQCDVHEETGKSFEELGLDARLLRALAKKGVTTPTPIQHLAIPHILEGKDVVAQAKTGSGKTYVYLLPLLHNLFKFPAQKIAPSAPTAIVLVPTRELCQQVYSEVLTLLELCRVQYKVVQITGDMPIMHMRTMLAGMPDVLISTPACVFTCLSNGSLRAVAIKDSLSILVLDEADLLLSFGYEDDLKALTSHVSNSCQCLLMSATLSADVEKLNKLVLHNPCILTPPVERDLKRSNVPDKIDQFRMLCNSHDKLLYVLALLKYELVETKALIFVNTIDMAYKLKIFLEQFGIRSAVLNAALPHNSRLHIIEAFNATLFEYLIATDNGQNKESTKIGGTTANEKRKHKRRQNLDPEFGVVRGIDFKDVKTVINCEMPQNPAGYIHRIGRTGRVGSYGTAISLVSPEELEIFEEIKVLTSGDGENKDSAKLISDFSLLSANSVESLRYRAEDVARSVTKAIVRDAMAKDLREEILNSEKLKAHFQANPRELDLLKHDKMLSKKRPCPHLETVPGYLVDPATLEASKVVKLAAAAMSKGQPATRGKAHRRVFRSKDPLRAFSSQ